MAVQFRVTNYNVTASGIVLTAEYKRDADVEALPNSAENIVYPSGSTKDSILADLQARATSKIAIYGNNLIVQQAIDDNLNKWITCKAQT